MLLALAMPMRAAAAAAASKSDPTAEQAGAPLNEYPALCVYEDTDTQTGTAVMAKRRVENPWEEYERAGKVSGSPWPPPPSGCPLPPSGSPPKCPGTCPVPCSASTCCEANRCAPPGPQEGSCCIIPNVGYSAGMASCQQLIPGGPQKIGFCCAEPLPTENGTPTCCHDVSGLLDKECCCRHFPSGPGDGHLDCCEERCCNKDRGFTCRRVSDSMQTPHALPFKNRTICCAEDEIACGSPNPQYGDHNAPGDLGTSTTVPVCLKRFNMSEPAHDAVSRGQRNGEPTADVGSDPPEMPPPSYFDAIPVGRGDGTLIYCADTVTNPNAPRVLVDLGSMGGTNLLYKDDPDALRKFILGSETAGTLTSKLTVIITHPDCDHYNLLPTVFPDPATQIAGSVIYGGSAAKFNTSATFKAWLDKMRYGQWVGINSANAGRGVPVPCAVIASVGGVTLSTCRNAGMVASACSGDYAGGDTTELTVVAANLGQLPAPFQTPPRLQANANSIILHAKFHRAGPGIGPDVPDLTAMFVGDFEGAYVTAALVVILSNELSSYAPVDVYKVAHHGAANPTRNYANRNELLAVVKPSIAFASSSDASGGFHHPKCTVVDRMTGKGGTKNGIQLRSRNRYASNSRYDSGMFTCSMQKGPLGFKIWEASDYCAAFFTTFPYHLGTTQYIRMLRMVYQPVPEEMIPFPFTFWQEESEARTAFLPFEHAVVLDPGLLDQPDDDTCSGDIWSDDDAPPTPPGDQPRPLLSTAGLRGTEYSARAL